MPWTGTFTKVPWKGKYGYFIFGNHKNGLGITTHLQSNGTLRIEYMIADNLDEVARTGIEGNELLKMAIKYHGLENILRVKASFGNYVVGSTSMSKNWEFFNRWRYKSGDLNALKRHYIIKKWMKDLGFENIRITNTTDETIHFEIFK